MPDATEGDDPMERLLDVFVYAPIGLLATGGANLDEFARKGRERAAVARTLGEFALQGVDAKLGRSLADLEGMAREFLRVVIANTTPSSTREPSTDDSASSTEVPAADASTAPTPVDGPVDDLIPGYDDLTARDLLPLLAGLGAADLDRIEAHEIAHRNRSTVLARLRRERG